MPSSPLDDILASIDPIDAATLFATLKGAVPLGMMFRSGELNRGEQEALERKYAGIPRAAPAPREPTVEEQIAEFERQFPNPVMRRVMVEELLKQRQLQPQPKPALGPRRVYPEPVITQEMRPIRRMKGGSVKKTLDEMQAELAKKGVKDAPDLSRRSFFGLPQSQSFPLAKLPTKELEKLRDAPSVEQSMTRITPSADAPKIEQTVKKVAETPVSRRTVLRSATGQVLKGVPGVSEIAKDVVGDVAQTAAKQVMPMVPLTVQGAIARAAKMGLDEDQTVALLKRMGMANESDLYYLMPSLRNPYDIDRDVDIASRAQILSEYLGTNRRKPMEMRSPLREIKRENPEMYEQVRRAAQDLYEYGLDDYGN